MIAIQQQKNNKAKALKQVTKITRLRFILLRQEIIRGKNKLPKNKSGKVCKYENEKDIFAPRLKKRLFFKKVLRS